jgi:pentapeptide MXKDX repeat protein
LPSNPRKRGKSRQRKNFLKSPRNKGRGGCVPDQSGISRLQNRLSNKGSPTMTIRTRIALGVSAAALSLSLALAPAAFAQDKMGKDDGMKKDTMSKDAMKKDDGMKKDSMSKDAMKKDDGMKKDEMKK